MSKTVSTYTGSAWQVSQKLKYVWHGWLMLVELEEDAQQDDDVMRKYTWGLDLVGQSGATGSLEGAGGILDTTSPRQAQVGGLLAVEEPQTVGGPLKYVYTYDANGNVGQVVDLAAASAAASIKVKYEYGPYGSRVNTPAQDEYEQPFRFSTKQWDDETGLGYWGYRYYSPVLGRWMSRDPIEEDGGLHLYGFVVNKPVSAIDSLGLQMPPPGVGRGPVLPPGHKFGPDPDLQTGGSGSEYDAGHYFGGAWDLHWSVWLYNAVETLTGGCDEAVDGSFTSESRWDVTVGGSSSTSGGIGGSAGALTGDAKLTVARQLGLSVGGSDSHTTNYHCKAKEGKRAVAELTYRVTETSGWFVQHGAFLNFGSKTYTFLSNYQKRLTSWSCSYTKCCK